MDSVFELMAHDESVIWTSLSYSSTKGGYYTALNLCSFMHCSRNFHNCIGPMFALFKKTNWLCIIYKTFLHNYILHVNSRIVPSTSSNIIIHEANTIPSRMFPRTGSLLFPSPAKFTAVTVNE